MSFNSTEPSILFGGTQERIKDRFILAAGDSYTAGATGGETTHEHNWGLRYNLFYGGFMGRDNEILRGLKYSGTSIADIVEGVNTGDSKAMVSNTGVGSDYTTDTRNSAGYNLISNLSLIHI